MQKILILFAAASLSACASYSPKPFVTPLKKNSVITATAAVSHMIVVDRNADQTICIAPEPDASFAEESGKGFSISFLAFGGNEKGSSDQRSGSEEVEFVGRSPAVLMAREMLYRICELSVNQGLSKDETVDLFHKALNMIDVAWQVEAANTRIHITDTLLVDEPREGLISDYQSERSAHALQWSVQRWPPPVERCNLSQVRPGARSDDPPTASRDVSLIIT